MTEIMFDHDRLDVYQLAIQYAAESFAVAKGLSGLHRHARDQWLRAAQSIPLNIAEGNGKRSPKDRARFFDVARGSALECAAIRVVSMLTRMTMKSATDTELQAGLVAAIDYEHEHRSAEHEHEEQPEPGRST